MSPSTSKISKDEILAALVEKLDTFSKTIPDASHDELEDWQLWAASFLPVWVGSFVST
jgi:hypothetical protein